MYRIAFRVARLFALLGGSALSLLIVLTCASVVGRALNTILHNDFFQNSAPGLAKSLLATGVGPINGDFEMVEAGMAFAIFAFLPLCQLQFAHASVDVFTRLLPERINRALRAVIEVVFAACIVLIAVQLTAGMVSKFRSGQTSLLLQYPIWWSYAVSTVAVWVVAFIAVYVGAMRVVESLTGRAVLPQPAEALH